MPAISYGVSVSGAGASIQSTVSRSADGVASREITLPVGKAGTLSTRTDDDTGEATLGSGHGITTGMIVDVWWASGVRYGVTVGTVDGLDVPLDGGAGDAFPIATTAIVVTPQVQINADIDGDALALLAAMASYSDVSSTARAHCDFQESDATSIEAVELQANAPQVWDITGGATNGFSGDPIAKIEASNSSSTEEATLKIIWAADSTP